MSFSKNYHRLALIFFLVNASGLAFDDWNLSNYVIAFTIGYAIGAALLNS